MHNEDLMLVALLLVDHYARICTSDLENSIELLLCYRHGVITSYPECQLRALARLYARSKLSASDHLLLSKHYTLSIWIM